MGVRARAARLASDRLEEMLGLASGVVEREISEGNSQVAMWLIDRVRPAQRGNYMAIDSIESMERASDVVAAARQAVIAVGQEVSLADGKAYFDLLERFGAIRGLSELEELRAQVEKLDSSSQETRLPSDHLPSWFKPRPGAGAASGGTKAPQ